MTKSEHVQEESGLSPKIVAVLIQLRNNHNLTNRKIAERVKVDESYLSGIYNGKRPGSEQLLAALEMFLELETLKKKPLALQLRELTAKVDFMLNDVNSGTPGSADSAMVSPLDVEKAAGPASAAKVSYQKLTAPKRRP